MKSVIAIVFFMILFTGCITEKTERSTRYRIIKNTTDHNVELIIITNESNSYNLAKGDSIVFEGYCETGFGDFCFIPWDENSPISGKLVFDNKREIIYVSSDCESGRNPLGRIRSSPLCSYLVRSIDGRREYIYYIDDSDYDRAVPIED